MNYSNYGRKSLWAATVLGTISLALGCSGMNSGQEQQAGGTGQGNSEATCGVWESFEGLSLIDSSGSKQDRGNLKCSKKAVIFVHGWTKESPTPFHHSDLWRSAGYNTFVFEWVELARGGAFEVFAQNTPKAAAKLVSAVNKLEKQIAGLDLQIVGHSFGSKVTIEAASKLARPLQLLPQFQNRDLRASGGSTTNATSDSRLQLTEFSTSAADLGGPSSGPTNRDIFNVNRAKPTLRLTRLTLLDPATLLDLGEAEKICNAVSVGRPSRSLNYTISSELRSKISLIMGFGTKIESYATNVAGIVSTSLPNMVPTLDMTVGCGLKQRGRNIIETHNLVVSDYFASIAENSPPKLVDDKGAVIGNVFSAVTPTQQLPSRGIRYDIVNESDAAKPLEEQSYRQKNNEGNRTINIVLEPGEISAGLNWNL